MSKLILNKVLNEMEFNDLPDSWNFINTASFSDKKRLYDYQNDAIKNIIKGLYLYYEKNVDYVKNETSSINETRKKYVYDMYVNMGAEKQTVDLRQLKKHEYLFDIYEDFYKTDKNGTLSFSNFANRMALWMATGSGKTLVIIKLFEVIDRLIKNFEIPKKDILFMAPKSQIIDQTIQLAKEYSNTPGNPYIRFVELNRYENVKNQNRLTSEDEITVYFYRSDNISDESGEKLLDYKRYQNNGDWYIILDEAHKGDRASSKRQAYYSIMSRNGYLFNFSATFTSNADYITTAFDIKLDNFIKKGYGKNIYISDSEFAFTDDQDSFSNLNKQKIVLKSLIALTFSKLFYKELRKVNKVSYHSPMMITLTNTVSAENSDLHLYFNELRKFAKNDFDYEVFNEAKEEFIDEINRKENYTYGSEKIELDINYIRKIVPKDVLINVFNTISFGSIEFMDSLDNREIGLRLKTSETPIPFALIKIGDTSEWRNSILQGYEYSGSFEEKNYFSRINEINEINILMGSRAFYEGWDSNRPAVLNCINIGTSDAKKFILQAIGRGIRVEPLKNKRKRLMELYSSGIINESQFTELKPFSKVLEVLFIFSTDKKTIKNVIETTENQRTENDQKNIKLERGYIKNQLLIPKFKKVKKDINELPKFDISENTLMRLKSYLDSTSDNVLLMNHQLTPLDINILRRLIQDKGKLFKISQESHYNDLGLLINKLIIYINLKEREVDKFEEVKDIVHFEKIMVDVDDYEPIKEKISVVREFGNKEKYDSQDFYERLYAGDIAPKATYRDIDILHIAEHYYSPLLLSSKENANYIKHIINVNSEVNFIKKLTEYTKENKKHLNDFYDWWMFSKLNEHLDDVYIPYIDADKTSIRKFKPDFIFWLCKENKYRIIFVDPKGPSQLSYVNKLGYFRKLFENKEFTYGNYKITVELKLYNEVNPFTDDYLEHYWIDSIDDIFN